MIKKNGFTLLEMLIVLSIWSVIILLVVPISDPHIAIQREKRFLETFEHDVLFIQRLSTITLEEEVRIEFSDNKYSILRGNKDEIIAERNIPSNWELQLRLLKNISFDHYGRVRYPRTITITTPLSEYDIIFPLGKGRCYIVKM